MANGEYYDPYSTPGLGTFVRRKIGPAYDPSEVSTTGPAPAGTAYEPFAPESVTPQYSEPLAGFTGQNAVKAWENSFAYLFFNKEKKYGQVLKAKALQARALGFSDDEIVKAISEGERWGSFSKIAKQSGQKFTPEEFVTALIEKYEVPDPKKKKYFDDIYGYVMADYFKQKAKEDPNFDRENDIGFFLSHPHYKPYAEELKRLVFDKGLEEGLKIFQDKYTPPAEEMGEKMGLEDAAYLVTLSSLYDLPVLLLASLGISFLSPVKSPPHIMGCTLAAVEGMKHKMIQDIEHGETTWDNKETYKRALDNAIQMVKAYGLGRFAGEVGAFVESAGTAFPFISKEVLALTKTAKGVERLETQIQLTKTGQAAKLAAEGAAFGVAQPVLEEGRAPTYEDVILGIIPIVGLDIATRFGRYIYKRVSRTKESPVDVAQEISKRLETEEGRDILSKLEETTPEAVQEVREAIEKKTTVPEPAPEPKKPEEPVKPEETEKAGSAEVGKEKPRTIEEEPTIEEELLSKGIFGKSKIPQAYKDAIGTIFDRHLYAAPFVYFLGGLNYENGVWSWDRQEAEKNGAVGLAFLMGPKARMFMGKKGVSSPEKVYINFELAQNLARQFGVDRLIYKNVKNNEAIAKIKAATGWELTAEGKWITARSDANAILKKSLRETVGGPYDLILKKHKLGDILDHPELFGRYPWLKDITVQVDRFYTYYSDADQTIHIEKNLDRTEFKQSLLHEINHAIQRYEGFAGGTNESAAYMVLTKPENLSKVIDHYHDILSKGVITEERHRQVMGLLFKIDSLKEKYAALYDDIFITSKKLGEIDRKRDEIKKNLLTSNIRNKSRAELLQIVKESQDLSNERALLQSQYNSLLQEKTNLDLELSRYPAFDETFKHTIYQLFEGERTAELAAMLGSLQQSVLDALFSHKAHPYIGEIKPGQTITFTGETDFSVSARERLSRYSPEKTDNALKDLPSPERIVAEQRVKMTPDEEKVLRAIATKTPLPQTAESVESMISATRKITEAIQAEERPRIKKFLKSDQFKRNWADVASNVKKALIETETEAGRWAKIHKVLAAGAPGKVAKMMDELYQATYHGLSRREQKTLDEIIYLRTATSIAESTQNKIELWTRRKDAIETAYKQGKLSKEDYAAKIAELGNKPHFTFTAGLTPEAHRLYLKKLKSKLGDPTFAMLTSRADAYYDMMRKNLREMYEEGLLTEGAYRSMLNRDYSMRQLIEFIDPEVVIKTTGKVPISVPDSGIEKLKGGDYGMLELDPLRGAAQVFARSQARIFKNRANRALARLAREHPLNGVVIEPAEEGQAPPRGWETIYFMEGGQRKSLFMPKKFADEWIASNPEITSQWAYMLGFVTGQKLLKALATGYNPAFVITNIPRDIPLMWLVTSEQSAFLPKALMQMGKEMGAVMSDTLLRKGRYDNFVDQGGMFEFLTHYGRLGGTKETAELSKVLGYIGESSEILTRLALREMAIKNRIKALGREPTPEERLAIETEATEIARDYMDFSQGGSFAKAIDSQIPYFNASIVAARSLFRAAKRDPALFATKVSQLMLISAGLYLYNFFNHREAWEQISDFDKANNWIICTGGAFTDEKNEKRHNFIKIAKEQNIQWITSSIDALMTRYHEGKVPTDQLITAFGNILQTQILPPTLAMIYSYLANVDFWTMEKAWKGDPGVASEMQYTKYTHPLAVDVGRITGLSPDKMAAAASRIAPPSNFFVSTFLGGYKVYRGELMEEFADKSWRQIITEFPAARRIYSSTHPFTKYKPEFKEPKYKTIRYTQNLELDKLADRFLKTGSDKDLEKVYDFLDRVEQESPEGIHARKRLEQRFETNKALFNIPNRAWWVNLRFIGDPEERAEFYWRRYKNASKEEKEEMEDILSRLKEIRSERFLIKLAELEETE